MSFLGTPVVCVWIIDQSVSDRRRPPTPYEVRSAEDYFCDLPELTIAPDMLTLAEHILDRKAGEFNPATFRDRYEEALLAHLKAEQAGTVPECKQMFARRSGWSISWKHCAAASPRTPREPRRTREELRQSRRPSGREYHAAVRRNAAAGSQP
jgi:hypothetical protein